jgi:hypothetical protein
MARYCASCGTEVDDTAVFCPTCGQPIEDADEVDIPPAPIRRLGTMAGGLGLEVAGRGVRPCRRRGDERDPARAREEGEEDHDEEPSPDAPTRIEARPAPIGTATPADRPRPPAREERAEDRQTGGGLPSIDLPITMPVTLSGWLVGIGSVLAVIGLVVILVVGVLNVIDLLLLLALLAVAATVFFAAHLPGVPHLRLLTLVVALIAFGVALDRVGFRGGGVGELLLFLGTAAAAIGAIILELGHDQPLGGPQR